MTPLPWTDLLEAVRRTLVGAGLDRLSPDAVLVHPFPSDRPRELPAAPRPAILLSPLDPEQCDPERGTNAHDLWTFDTQLLLVGEAGGDLASAARLYSELRARVVGCLHQRRLPLAGSLPVVVEPLEVGDRALFLERRVWLSRLRLHCPFLLIREPAS
ncbi:MAG: hypothetical protein ACKOGA_14995 [Planctomycetaceae bacterium]